MKIIINPPQSIHEIGQRPNQEDAIAQWDNRLFVLCDGMGGHERGEVASQTVSQALVTWFRDNVNPDEPFTDDMLHAALEYAYTELDKFDDDSPKKMGTTLTLLYIHAHGITAAHIGDSRIYHFRPAPTVVINSSPKFLDMPSGKAERGEVPDRAEECAILYQSRDHSLAFDLFQSGEISYDEMLNFPQKNIVTRAMTPGADNRMRPDIIHITDIQPDDWFYLCSDGMLELMTNDELLALLSSDATDEEKTNWLIKATAGNQDNHSAWLIHIKDVIREIGDETLANEEPTARCNALNIIRQRREEQDTTDDVQIVSMPISQPKRKIWKWLWPVLCGVFIAVADLFLYHLSSPKTEEVHKPDSVKPVLHRPQPMNRPITRPLLKPDTTNKDTTNHGTAKH